MIEKIVTHTVDGIGHLVEQFKGKVKLAALLTVFLDQIQEIEDALYQLLTERSLATAVGAQLDGLGSIVGEPRQYRTDADYRQALYKRIGMNVSKGTPEDILRVLPLFENRAYKLTEYDAFFIIYALGPITSTPALFLSLLQSIKPASVRAGFHYSDRADSDVFTLASGTVVEKSSTQGLAPDDRSTGGHLSGMVM